MWPFVAGGVCSLVHLVNVVQCISVHRTFAECLMGSGETKVRQSRRGGESTPRGRCGLRGAQTAAQRASGDPGPG